MVTTDASVYLVVLQIVTTILMSLILYRSQKRDKRDEHIDKMFEEICSELRKKINKDDCDDKSALCAGHMLTTRTMLLKPLEDKLMRLDDDFRNHFHTKEGSAMSIDPRKMR